MRSLYLAFGLIAALVAALHVAQMSFPDGPTTLRVQASDAVVTLTADGSTLAERRAARRVFRRAAADLKIRPIELAKRLAKLDERAWQAVENRKAADRVAADIDWEQFLRLLIQILELLLDLLAEDTAAIPPMSAASPPAAIAHGPPAGVFPSVLLL